MDGVGDLLDLIRHALCLGVLGLRLLYLRHYFVGKSGFGGIELAAVRLAGVVGGALVGGVPKAGQEGGVAVWGLIASSTPWPPAPGWPGAAGGSLPWLACP